MRKSFYLKFALLGIQKNKQLYVPYLLAGICMVTVFFVFAYLGFSNVVRELPGKTLLPAVFLFATVCVGFFSIPFLFYTNASLIQKRKKELGLYQTLGMNKKNMMYMMLWEMVFSYGIVMFFGILFGSIFSRLAELVLIRIMKKEVIGQFRIEWDIIKLVSVVYLGIYILIFLNSLYQVCKSKTLALLQSDMEGERVPKGNSILALCSIVFIVISYIMMNYFQITLFSKEFFCVIGLISIGTFFLFISASVWICQFLKSRKSYYYQTSHFVPVSFMAFRMKRNGAGLGAICILMTMILSSMSVSLAFYATVRNLLEDHYPHTVGVSVRIPVEKMKDEIELCGYTKTMQDALQDLLVSTREADCLEAYSANLLGVIQDGVLDLGIDLQDTWYQTNDMVWEKDDAKIVLVHFISMDTYHQFCGTNETLDDKEVLLASETTEDQMDQIRLWDGATYMVGKKTKKIPPMSEVQIENRMVTAQGCEEMFVAVNDLLAFMGGLEGLEHYEACNELAYEWGLEFDWSGKEEALLKVYQDVTAVVEKQQKQDDTVQIRSYFRPEREERLVSVKGAILFLVINFNLLFMIVISLIMYYKQLSEGYEDQKRFEILKKVGMSQEEIKSSVHAQMKLVFTFPLLIGTVHFVFMKKLFFEMFQELAEIKMVDVIQYMIISYCIFLCFYGIVYWLTSKKYLEIVEQS